MDTGYSLASGYLFIVCQLLTFFLDKKVTKKTRQIRFSYATFSL